MFVTNRLDKTFLVLKKLSGGGYVSGQALGDMLGISRAGVLRHVCKLRDMGYVIDSESRKGHLLVGGEVYSDYSIRLRMERDVPVDFVEETESTNLLAKSAPGVSGAVVAEKQTAGRGRKARSFCSEPGGVYLSYFFRPRAMLPSDAVKTVLFAGIAVCRTLEAFGIEGRVKWPNDVLAGGRKICGILSEMIAQSDGIERIVVGIGVNVNNEPGVDTAVSMTEILGRKVCRSEVAARVLDELCELVDCFEREGFGRIREEYLERSCTVGARVLVTGEKESFEADAVDLDDNGFLVVERGNGRERVIVGDVTVRPAAKQSEAI